MLKHVQDIDLEQLSARLAELKHAAAEFADTRIKRHDLSGLLQLGLRPIERMILRAESHWPVGTNLPAMGRLRGVLRGVMTPLAKSVLRIGQLITRDQREYNRAILNAVRALHQVMMRLGPQVTEEIVTRVDSNAATLQEELNSLRARIDALEQARIRERH
jgi:hypothetical protein